MIAGISSLNETPNNNQSKGMAEHILWEISGAIITIDIAAAGDVYVNGDLVPQASSNPPSSGMTPKDLNAKD